MNATAAAAANQRDFVGQLNLQRTNETLSGDAEASDNEAPTTLLVIADRYDDASLDAIADLRLSLRVARPAQQREFVTKQRPQQTATARLT